MTANPTRIKRKRVSTPEESSEEVSESATPSALTRRRVVVKKADTPPVSRVIKRTGAGDPPEKSDPPPNKPLPPPRTRVEPETMKVEEILETGGMPKVKTLSVKRPLPPSSPSKKAPEPEPPVEEEEVVVKKKSPPLREVLGEPTFKFFCYRCGQKLQVPVSWANKHHSCARCGHDILIPPPLIGEFW